MNARWRVFLGTIPRALPDSIATMVEPMPRLSDSFCAAACTSAFAL